MRVSSLRTQSNNVFTDVNSDDKFLSVFLHILLSVVNCRVFAFIHLVDVVVGGLVEKCGTSSLALELNVPLVFLSLDFHDFSSSHTLFVQFLLSLALLLFLFFFLFLFFLFFLLQLDLSPNLKGELPGLVRHFISLGFFDKLLSEQLENVVRLVIGEEGCLRNLISLSELFAPQSDNLRRIHAFELTKINILIGISIDLVVELDGSPSRSLLLSTLFLSLLESGLPSCNLFIRIFTVSEFHEKGLHAGILTIHPWIGNNVCEGITLVSLGLEHHGNESLEVFCEKTWRFSIFMEGPELIGSVRGKQLVVRIFHLGCPEGWAGGVKDEKDNT